MRKLDIEMSLEEIMTSGATTKEIFEVLKKKIEANKLKKEQK